MGLSLCAPIETHGSAARWGEEAAEEEVGGDPDGPRHVADGEGVHAGGHRATWWRGGRGGWREEGMMWGGHGFCPLGAGFPDQGHIVEARKRAPG